MYVFEKKNLNKKVGILGLGLSGVSAFRYFKRIGLEIVGWDDSAEVRKNNNTQAISKLKDATRATTVGNNAM